MRTFAPKIPPEMRLNLQVKWSLTLWKYYKSALKALWFSSKLELVHLIATIFFSVLWRKVKFLLVSLIRNAHRFCALMLSRAKKFLSSVFHGSWKVSLQTFFDTWMWLSSVWNKLILTSQYQLYSWSRFIFFKSVARIWIFTPNVDIFTSEFLIK